MAIFARGRSSREWLCVRDGEDHSADWARAFGAAAAAEDGGGENGREEAPPPVPVAWGLPEERRMLPWLPVGVQDGCRRGGLAAAFPLPLPPPSLPLRSALLCSFHHTVDAPPVRPSAKQV